MHPPKSPDPGNYITTGVGWIAIGRPADWAIPGEGRCRASASRRYRSTGRSAPGRSYALPCAGLATGARQGAGWSSSRASSWRSRWRRPQRSCRCQQAQAGSWGRRPSTFWAWRIHLLARVWSPPLLSRPTRQAAHLQRATCVPTGSVGAASIITSDAVRTERPCPRTATRRGERFVTSSRWQHRYAGH